MASIDKFNDHCWKDVVYTAEQSPACTYDRAELTHKVNLFDMHHRYADVMHIDEVLAHLGAMALQRAAE